MASDVMSLFGLNPNALQQQRTNDAVTQASAMNPFFAAGAAGGALMGQSVNSALGLQTPEMAQAEGVQESLEGADLTTPEGMRDAASKLMQAGDYATAMDLYSRASSMVAAEPRPVAAKADTLGSEGLYEETYSKVHILINVFLLRMVKEVGNQLLLTVKSILILKQNHKLLKIVVVLLIRLTEKVRYEL